MLQLAQVSFLFIAPPNPFFLWGFLGGLYLVIELIISEDSCINAFSLVSLPP